MRDSLDSIGPAKPSPGGSAGALVPTGAAGTYVNPVLDADFPDPAVILAVRDRSTIADLMPARYTTVSLTATDLVDAQK